MEGSLEDILLFNLIHLINGIKIHMLLYSLFQTRKNLSSLILKHLMHFVLILLVELAYLVMDTNFIWTMIVIKIRAVIVILDILIKLQKALLITLINLRIT
jgi:hypothetical protein